MIFKEAVLSTAGQPGLRCSSSLRGWQLRRRTIILSSPVKLSVKNALNSHEPSGRLFEQLAEEHCQVARVSLARFPGDGFGWLLREPYSAAAGAIANNHTTRPPSPQSGSAASPHELGRTPAVDPALAATTAGLTESCIEAATRDSADDDDVSDANDNDRGPLTLLSVPLRLCLSHEVPGCCPPALRSPALRELFFGAGRDQPWEVHLAGALLWACRAQESPRAGARAGAGAGARPTTAAVSAGAAVTAAADGSGCGSAPHATDAGGSDGVGSDGCADDADVAFAEFWRRYRALLPDVGSLGTVLFFGEGELRELQDPELAAEARAWQQTVRNAYDKWIAAPAFRTEVGEVSLEEWMWAVGCVESRAFGFRAPADGRELHVYVPFFCLANYQPGAPTLHVLRLHPDPDLKPQSDPDSITIPDPDAAPTGRLAGRAGGEQRQRRHGGEGGSDAGSCLAGLGGGSGSGYGAQGQRRYVTGGWEPTADMLLIREGHHRRRLHEPASPSKEPPPPQQQQQQQRQSAEEGQDAAVHARERGRGRQVYIDYGKKDNRALLNQYGFILYGNPYDRLGWAGTQLDSTCRTRRDWVYETAEQLSREAAEAAEAEAAEAKVLPGDRRAGGGSDGVASPSGRDPRLPYGGTEAVRRRFRNVATSIVEACGWRNLRERRLVSADSEQRALGALTRWVEDELEGFPTSVQHDSQILSLPLPMPLLLATAGRRRTGKRDAAAAGATAASRRRWSSGEVAGGVDRTSSADTSGAPGVHGAKGGPAGSALEVAPPNGFDTVSRTGPVDGTGVDGHGAGFVCASTSRLRAAVEYRLERKLLLLAGWNLLRRLQEGCGAQEGA